MSVVNYFCCMLSQVINIFTLNIKLEWQQRRSYFAILLYVLTSVYLTYLVFNSIMEAQTWNSLFWIIFIFAAVQAAYRSFYFEADRRFLLYFGMVRPEVLILGKVLYNFVYLVLIGLLNMAVFLFLMGDLVNDPLAFLCLLVVGSMGFASIFTFVAAIAAKAGNNPALPAILSIPLIYPQVLALSRTSLRALTGFSWEVNAPLLLVLALLSVIALLLSYVLFAYLWRD